MVLRYWLGGRAVWAVAVNLGMVFGVAAGHGAGVFDTVYDFTGQVDGATPNASVTVDLAGNIYGGAAQGGIACNDGSYSAFGCGTIYKIDPTGKQTTLFSFSGADGVGPSTKLTLTADLRRVQVYKYHPPVAIVMRAGSASADYCIDAASAAGANRNRRCAARDTRGSEDG